MAYRADDLRRLVQGDHTDTVRALEDDTTTLILGDLDRQLDTLARSLLAAGTRAFGAPEVPGPGLDRIVTAARAAVRRLLAPLADRAGHLLAAAIPSALALGRTQAAEFLRAAAGRALPAPRVRATRALRDQAARVTRAITDHTGHALALLGRGQVTRWTHLLHAVGAARTAAAAVRAHTAWVIGQCVNAGLDAASRPAGMVRLWVAEADACVRCLAYTGRTAPTGGTFPGGLSWDPRQRHTRAAAVSGPPLHPHCRCRTVPWNPRWRPAPGAAPFPLALAREAQRSLAYGRHLGSESQAARLRAAAELLRTTNDLLPAVEAHARTAVRARRFPAAA
jgi:hypothetical protein